MTVITTIINLVGSPSGESAYMAAKAITLVSFLIRLPRMINLNNPPPDQSRGHMVYGNNHSIVLVRQFGRIKARDLSLFLSRCGR